MNIVDIWEICLKCEYDEKKLTNGLAIFLKDHKDKKIIDCACGSGFAILDLISKGYNIECSDGSTDMLRLFSQNAKKKGLDIVPRHLMWNELGKECRKQFDVVMCRGGSLPYACTWDAPEKNNIKVIRESIENFYKALVPGGMVYIDVTNEQPEHVAYEPQVIDGKNIVVSEIVKIDRDKKTRLWKPCVSVDGKKYNLERYSYYISDKELIDLMIDVGFKHVTQVAIDGEYYHGFVGYKPLDSN